MERRRPIGFSPGSAAFAAAWVVGLGIARLTGSPAVVLLLVAAAATFAGSAIGAWFRLRRVVVDRIVAPTVATVGEDVPVSIILSDRDVVAAPVALTISTPHGAAPLARVDGAGAGAVTASIAFPAAGVVDELVVGVESAGAAGLLWWRGRARIAVEPIHVAPVAAGGLLPVEASARRAHDRLDRGHAARRGPTLGDLDGIRQWRDGDPDHAVHWPSTMRAGELIVRDRSVTTDRRWIVRLDRLRRRPSADGAPAQPSPAARLRQTLEEGLRRGHDVIVDDGSSDAGGRHVVRSADDAARWSALCAEAPPPPGPRPALHRRTLRLGHGDEPQTVSARARWLTAGAAFAAIGMLTGALTAAMTSYALAAAGIVAGVLVSVRYGAAGRVRPVWLRVVIGGAALTALVLIAADAQGVDGLLRALRGPLPDLLIALVVIHGFEATDRRTVRVHLAISSVVVAYATGLRIDDRVAWWLVAWGALVVAATRATAGTARRSADRAGGARTRPSAVAAGRWKAARLTASSAAVAAATVAVLGLVPIPDGPANLGLPALADDALAVDSPGALAGPDGSISRPGDRGDGTRGALGQVGGYPGFSETLDTSIRGDLGDEVVLRVKAPEPAFWRGQTFSDFDGRFWTVSPDRGRPQAGPTIEVPPTLGDDMGAPTSRFVQTFHVEADLPNVVFAASRPAVLMFEGTVHTRPDGALRAGSTLGAGSVYTVVSRRVEVTADSLRAQGDVGEWFAQFDDPQSIAALAPYLALPASTTERTVALAGRLRAATTYDTILAYEGWLAANTVYDIDAPVPADGTDAVDDYLFTARRGFCEQIASSLVVMLRSQGVPARLASGYLPGERDRVSGVWQVRARDAHAWVEVWFPGSGWQPFDPTAEVPLSGDVEQGTIGGDLVAAAISTIAGRLAEGAVAGAALLVGYALLRQALTIRRRRARGRWGLLQDRFTTLGSAVGEPAGPPLTNPLIARRLALAGPGRDGGGQRGDDVAFVATALDRVRFDPAWTDDDAEYGIVRDEIVRLERSARA